MAFILFRSTSPEATSTEASQSRHWSDQNTIAKKLRARDTDFSEMFWPQVIRGVAIMFCLLPPTRLALGALSETQVPDASGVFNLMRNLGGAIGIALIDTILYGRTSIHADAIRVRLLAGDMTTATAIGLDPGLFASGLSGR